MDWKDYAGRLKSRLEKERDELKQKARRTTRDFREDLEGLEDKWHDFVDRLSEIELSEVTDDMRETADGLAAELREGYAKLKDRIREQRGRGERERGEGGERGESGRRETSEGQPAEQDADGAARADAGTESSYTMGYGEEFLQVLRRRRAETHAAELLSRLKPGMRVLDVGCGTGTISVGLADAVAPGRLHGIDVEASQIEIARAAAKAGGHGNATFETGDVTNLAFEDDSFDAVHCHAVLMHIPDTQKALAEIQRVLKPDGILSVRDLITASSFIEPVAGMDSAWDVFAKLLSANRGHPQLGKEIKRILVEAGFDQVEANASFETFQSPEERAFFYGFVADWFLSDAVVAAATEHGLVSAEQFKAWRGALDEWKAHPGGVAALAWGGAIATKG